MDLEVMYLWTPEHMEVELEQSAQHQSLLSLSDGIAQLGREMCK